MKQILVMMATVVVAGQSVLAADVVINDPIVRDVVAKMLKKPHGKFAPPLKLNEEELAKVTDLNLNITQITDAGLKDVAKLQNLTGLNLGGTQITDAGLKEVAKLQKLEVLYLRGTQITDVGLKDVVKLQKLTRLNLEFTKITDADAAELKKALPKCRIVHSYKKD